MFKNYLHDGLKEYLQKILPDMNDSTWSAFLSKTKTAEYSKGDHVYRAGGICNNISFVSQGLLRSYYLTVDGKEVVTSFANTGSYYSDYNSFLTQKPTKFYTQTLEDTILIDVSYNDLQELYLKHPQCERVGRLIAESLFKSLSDRNSSFQFETPEQRYRKFIEYDQDVAQRVPLYMIASYIGITPEALSRIRKRILGR